MASAGASPRRAAVRTQKRGGGDGSGGGGSGSGSGGGVSTPAAAVGAGGAASAAGAASTADAAGVRALVESCANGDDIAPLARFLFDAQAGHESPDVAEAEGRRAVAALDAALRSIADGHAAAIAAAAAGNANAVAGAVAQIGRLDAAATDVRAAIVGANGAVQASGSALIADVRALTSASAALANADRAAAALAAARGVLERCQAAGALLAQGRLHAALCALDALRRQHLAALQRLLARAPKGGGGGSALAALPGAARSSASGSGGGGARLVAYLGALADDLEAAARQLSVSDFTAWLVHVRGAARGIGAAAIREAAAARQLEDDLAAERRAALRMLAEAGRAGGGGGNSSGGGSGGGGKVGSGGGARQQQQVPRTCTTIGEALAGSEFRRRLLLDGDGDGSAYAAAAAAHEGSGAGSAPSVLDSLRALDIGSEAPPPPLPQRRKQHEQPAGRGKKGGGDEPSAAPTPADELDALYPGEPEAAIAELLRRRGVAAAGGKSVSSSATSGGAAAAAAKSAAADAAAHGAAADALLALDLGGLHRAVHVHRSLGRADAFRAYYLEQRRLQLAADAPPAPPLLEGYRPYLAAVTGFFVTEAYLARASDGFLPPEGRAALWAGAQRALKTALEAALAGARRPDEALALKDGALLAAAALERGGYAVAPLLEALVAGGAGYHSMLGAELERALAEAAAADKLEGFEVRTKEQHRSLVDDFGLPAALDAGGGPADQQQQQQQRRAPPPEPPYAAPYSASAPAALAAARRFVTGAAAYLRGLHRGPELLPALFAERDRALARAIGAAWPPRLAAAAAAGRLRDCLRCAANAWALERAGDALDEWTVRAARAAGGGGYDDDGDDGDGGGEDDLRGSGEGRGRDDSTAAAAAAASRARARARRLKSVLAAAGDASPLAAALRAARTAAEAAAVAAVAARLDELLAPARRTPAAEWAAPPAPFPPGSNSGWVAGAVSTLQETLDAAAAALPRESAAAVARGALREASAALLKLAAAAPALSRLGAERLAADVAAVERFAARWGGGATPGLAAELAAPAQLCALLLADRFDGALDPSIRAARYPALPLAAAAAALERYREAPPPPASTAAGGAAATTQGGGGGGGAPTRRAAEAVAKQLRAVIAAAATAAAGAAGGAAAGAAGGSDAARA